MNFFNTKNGRIVKTVISVILAVGILAGSIALITTLTNKKDDGLKKISPTFEVGGLTETGKYKETKLSLYTKESFGCQGLKITPDFDAKVNYQIYYYDEVDNFISASEVYTEGVTADVPASAIKARLVITPIWESGTEDKDKELNIFDALTYGGKLTIKVSDKQYDSIEEKITSSSNICTMFGRGIFDGVNFNASSTSPLYLSNEIEVQNYDSVIIKVKSSTYNGTVMSGEYEVDAFSCYMDKTKVTSGINIVLESDGFVYLSVDVSNASSLIVCVDVASADVMEIYPF